MISGSKNNIPSTMSKILNWLKSDGISENFSPRIEANKIAMDQFLKLRLNDSSCGVSIDGATTEVLDFNGSSSLDEGQFENYILTLFVVTPIGRHFHFISNTTGAPYVKFLLPDRAKLLLKRKFKKMAGKVELL